jgi:hypothetical protein
VFHATSAALEQLCTDIDAGPGDWAESLTVILDVPQVAPRFHMGG